MIGCLKFHLSADRQELLLENLIQCWAHVIGAECWKDKTEGEEIVHIHLSEPRFRKETETFPADRSQLMSKTPCSTKQHRQMIKFEENRTQSTQ